MLRARAPLFSGETLSVDPENYITRRRTVRFDIFYDLSITLKAGLYANKP